MKREVGDEQNAVPKSGERKSKRRKEKKSAEMK